MPGGHSPQQEKLPDATHGRTGQDKKTEKDSFECLAANAGGITALDARGRGFESRRSKDRSSAR
jgi:hypothetical protein